MEVFKIKKISISNFIKKKRKNLLKIICTSLIACGLIKTIDVEENNVFEQLVDAKNTYIENKVEDYIDKVSSSAILGSIVAVGNINDNGNYKFIDRVLYDENNNVVDLTNDSRYLYFNSVNVNKESFEIMNLKDSNTETIILSASSITDDCISCLPKSVKILYLKKCNFLTNLDELPKYCPNLEMLYLDKTHLDNLDFILDLPNLKIFDASESLCVTEDIINYLNENNIGTNITENDIDIQKKLQEIIDSIVTDDMSEKEKVRVICEYVLDHLEYDISLTDRSNEEPIEIVFFLGKGVCISYAHLTDALLRLAGIETYKIDNMNHIWNLLKVDEKYYYVDITNIDVGGDLRKKIFKDYGIDRSYMFSPTMFSSSSPTTTIGSNLTIIPSSLMEQVISNNDECRYNFNPDVFDLELLKLFVFGWSISQVCVSTKEVFSNCKKLSLNK